MIPNTAILRSAVLLSLLTIPFAHAEKTIDACQKQVDEKSSSLSRCLDGVVSHVDRELQTWVNMHSFNLEEKALVNSRYSALKMFKRSQSNFITYRENDCRWQYLAISPKKGADIAYKTCYIVLSQSRITALSKINTTD
jgi:uncharacterized protein YecT (DUF1311 family)